MKTTHGSSLILIPPPPLHAPSLVDPVLPRVRVRADIDVGAGHDGIREREGAGRPVVGRALSAVDLALPARGLGGGLG